MSEPPKPKIKIRLPEKWILPIIKPIIVPRTIGKEEKYEYDIPKWDRFCIWINGKKTWIGLGLGAVAGILSGVGMAAYPWLIPIAKGIIPVAAGLAGTGAVHKLLKKQIKFGDKDEFAEEDFKDLIVYTLSVILKWVALLKMKRKGGDKK